MSISIILNTGPSHVYTVGETIHGHVQVNLKKASQHETINTINLSFIGKSSIDIAVESGSGDSKSTTHHRSTAILFARSIQLTHPLFQPPVTRRGEDGATLTWPFAVKIPITADAIIPDVVKNMDASVFQKDSIFPASFGQDPTEQCQLLPSSLPRFAGSVGASTDISGSVVYRLNAEAMGIPAGIKGLWIGNKEEKLDVPIMVPPPDLRNLEISYQISTFHATVQSLQLLPTHHDGHLSIREHFRSAFKKSSLPAVDFQLAFSAPNILHLHRSRDQKLPFSFQVRRVARPPTPSQPSEEKRDEKVPLEDEIHTPTVFLKRIDINLMAMTTVRTPATYGRWNQGREETGTRTATICSCTPAPKMQSICELSVGESWFHIGEMLDVNWGNLHETNQVSGFSLTGDLVTPNIVRKYQIEWDIRLEIAGKEVRWKIRDWRNRNIGQAQPVRIVSG